MDEIVLAIPSAGTKVTRDILRICNQTECKLKVLPGMYQFITEEVSVSKLREVSIEDLLGRDAIDIDLDSVLGYVKGKQFLLQVAVALSEANFADRWQNIIRNV